MTDIIGSWVRGIAGAAIICGAALALTPKGKVREVLKVICGIVVIIAFVSPFIDNDSVAFSMDLSQYRAQADDIAFSAEKEQTNLSRSIIEQELTSYILDKAQTLGIEDLKADIVLKWGDEGFWYPYEIALEARAGTAEKNSLTSYIEGELGIPASRQHWTVPEDEGARNEDQS